MEELASLGCCYFFIATESFIYFYNWFSLAEEIERTTVEGIKVDVDIEAKGCGYCFVKNGSVLVEERVE